MTINGIKFHEKPCMSGNCPYRDKCKRYERTVKKNGHQLSIF